MADKRISQLIERVDIANNDVLPIVASGATTTNKVTVSTLQDWMQDNLDVGVTSVGLTMPSAFQVSGSPITTSGNITVTATGTASQYIRGDGTLADFPQGGGGGGASVSYYLNGSVSQGTIGGIAYQELSKTPILGAGTDFTIAADGYIASFITDAGDPALLEIPAGNWNFETYLQASSGGGTPTFYIELYKVSGSTATLIASNSANPELIAFGTNTTPYFSALAVPQTTLALTDRLAIRIYVVVSGRTITLHTENSNLCQIITTFTTGLTALNGLTAQVQNFATGTSGTDFSISSSGSIHTFNLPTASATNRGALSSTDWSTFNAKQDAGNYVTTDTTQTITGEKTFSGSSLKIAANGAADAVVLRNVNGTTGSDAGATTMGFNSSDNLFISTQSRGGFILAFNNSVSNRTYTLQDASGTLAFTSDLGAYLPLSGGTLTGALNGTNASFSGNVNDVISVTSTASTTAIKLNNTNANDWGSNIAFQSSSVNKGFVGLVGSLVGNTDHSICLFGAAGQSVKFFTNANTSPRLTLDSSTGAATFSSSVSVKGGLTIVRSNTSESSVISNEGNLIYNARDNFNHVFQSNGTEVARINTAGAATFSSSVTAGGAISINGNFPLILNSISGSTSQQIQYQNNGTNKWQIYLNTSNNSLNVFNSTNSSDRLTILESGNVGIGTSSPGAYRLYLQGNNAIEAIGIGFNDTGTNGRNYSIRSDQGSFIFQDVTGSAERMRITSGGYLKASNTGSYIYPTNSFNEFTGNQVSWNSVFTNSNANGDVLLLRSANSSTSFSYIAGYSTSAGAYTLQIYTNGNIQNSNNSYGSLSDIKLKENIQDATPKLDDLMKVKVRNYNLIGDDKKQIGVIAQELEEVFPAMIDESEDFEEVEVPQVDEEGNEILNEEGEVVTENKRISKGTTTKSVKYSVFVPMLIKAMQEQQEQIKSLTEQVEALKSQING